MKGAALICTKSNLVGLTLSRFSVGFPFLDFVGQDVDIHPSKIGPSRAIVAVSLGV